MRRHPRSPVEAPDETIPAPVEEAQLGAFFARALPALRAFRHPHYRLLWSSNVLSSTGSWMQNAVFGVLILDITGSPFLTVLIPAASQLMIGPLSPVGGLLADRYNRRTLLIGSQLAFTSTTTVLAVLALTGNGSAGAYLAISLLNGVFLALNLPVYQALFPRLVPERDLYNAVALNSVSFNLARIVGPALGAGILILTEQEGAIFAVNAVTYAVFALALFRIPRGVGAIRDEDREAGSRIRDGVAFARADRTVGTMILAIATVSLFGLPVVWLGPLMAARIFGDAQANGYILSALGGGAVIGSLASGTAAVERRPWLGAVFFGVFAISLGAFAWTTVPWMALVLIAIFGAAYMGLSVVTSSLVQLATPDRLRGRVMSLYMMAWVGPLPAGAIVGGIVAELVGGGAGAPVALGIGAGMCALFALRLGIRRDWIPRRFATTDAAAPIVE